MHHVCDCNSVYIWKWEGGLCMYPLYFFPPTSLTYRVTDLCTGTDKHVTNWRILIWILWHMGNQWSFQNWKFSAFQLISAFFVAQIYTLLLFSAQFELFYLDFIPFFILFWAKKQSFLTKGHFSCLSFTREELRDHVCKILKLHEQLYFTAGYIEVLKFCIKVHYLLSSQKVIKNENKHA